MSDCKDLTIGGLRDLIAQLEAERDALAAALDETDRAFERFAIHHGSCCGVHNSTDEAAPGECILCDVDRGARRHGDYADILAARDASMKRAGALEALRGLPVPRTVTREDADKHNLSPFWVAHIEGIAQYYRDNVAPALAALEVEEKGGPECLTT